MAEMGKYCKAYLAKNFRRFDGWTENLENLQPEQGNDPGGEAAEVQRTELKDDDILYLQEDYVVTDGIFIDENIIFDKVTDVWKAFCQDELEFEIPQYEPIVLETTAAEADETQ